jgi:hypothetical protein
VRKKNHELVLCPGIPKEWLANKEPIFLGPAQTIYGPVSVIIQGGDSVVTVSWQPRWHGPEPKIKIAFPGMAPAYVQPGKTRVEININP